MAKETVDELIKKHGEVIDRKHVRAIFSGESAVEGFEHPEMIRKWYAEHPESISKDPEDTQYAKEHLFYSILCEFRGNRSPDSWDRPGVDAKTLPYFNDVVFEPLARVIQAHEDVEHTAWRFASYVGFHGGSANCLNGLEGESDELKAKYLKVLEMNAQKGEREIAGYENALREHVMGFSSAANKMDALKRLEQGSEL